MVGWTRLLSVSCSQQQQQQKQALTLKIKVTLLYPNLSGEPALDLASLQPSVHFVLGCGEESTFHERGKRYR